MNSLAPQSIVESSRREFERAWSAGSPVSIESVLPEPADTRYLATLEELVHVDIEFSWRAVASGTDGAPRNVEAYIDCFPILRRGDIILRLAISEFTARRRNGSTLSAEALTRRLLSSGLAREFEASDPTGLIVQDPYVDARLLVQELSRRCEEPSTDEGTISARDTGLARVRDTVGQGGLQGDDANAVGCSPIPGYRILHRIAAGGMGVVFKAWQVGLERAVALKMIRSGTYASAEELSRFRREAVAVAKLQHPNIVQIFDIGTSGEQPYFSMEFVEGGSLAQKLDGQPWSARRAARFVAEIAAGMGYAHARNIVHRDLKPGNILLSPRVFDVPLAAATTDPDELPWFPKITDFGLAKQMSNLQDLLTQTEAVLGTPCYMAPEQAQGNAALASPASDVYSLGAILYELLVGRPPFKGSTPLETIRQVVHDEPVAPRRLQPNVPLDLETICLKCLAKDPRQRYDNATELLNDLTRFRDGLPIRARRLNSLERGLRWARRNYVGIGLSTAAMITLVLVAVVLSQGKRAARLETLGELNQQFDRRLAEPGWSVSYLQGMEEAVEQMGELSPNQAMDARRRLLKSFADKLDKELSRPRIDTATSSRLADSIDALSKRSPPLGDALREKLEQRSRLTLIDYRSGDTFQDLSSTPAMEWDGTGARLSPKFTGPPRSDGALVHACILPADCRGNVELEAVFASDWGNGQELALRFNVPVPMDPRHDGYRFELKSMPDRDGRSTSLGEARSKARNVQLSIIRDQQALRTVNIAAQSLSEGELRLRAVRNGNNVSFQVNDLSPLVHHDLFWSPRVNEGKLGIDLPAKVTLTSLHATRPAKDAGGSPLEQGDSLYQAGKFGEALANYDAQFAQIGDAELRSELIYKRALCQVALNRGEEALELLQPLLIGEGHWSQLAATQMWLWHLEKGEYQDADAIFDGLATRADFVELVRQLSVTTRNKMLDRYCNLANVYGLRANPNRVRDLKRALDLRIAVNEELWLISETRILLIDAYDRADRLEDAKEQVQYLLNHPDLSPEARCRMIDRMASFLVREGKHEEALKLVDATLLDGAGNVVANHEWMLLTRAAVLAATGNWGGAEKDLARYHDLPLDSVARSEPRAWLQRGIAARRLDGNLERARALWAEGYQLASDDGYHDVYLTSTLGLLSGRISKQDPAALFKSIRVGTGDGFGSQAIDIIRRGLIDESLIVSVLTQAARRERTLEYLERYASLQLTAEENTVLPPRLIAHELFSQMILGPQLETQQLSDDEEQLCWDLTQSLHEAYLRGGFKEAYLVPALWAWQGKKRIGWEPLSLALQSEPACRGPLAYVMACHFQHLGQGEAARSILETAASDATDLPRLARLVDAWREKHAGGMPSRP